MSWIPVFYDLYEKFHKEPGFTPMYHKEINVQIKVTISDKGEFIKAERMIGESKNEPIIAMVGCTLSAMSRTGGISPYALFDNFENLSGAKKDTEGNDSLTTYLSTLKKWVEYDKENSEIKKIYSFMVGSGKDIFTIVSDFISGSGDTKEVKIKDFVVFSIENMDTWKSKAIQDSWIKYHTEHMFELNPKLVMGVCEVTGKKNVLVYPLHSKVRKLQGLLVSSNDHENFTFRGDTYDEERLPFNMSVEVSQKAHAALNWFVNTQGMLDFDADTITLVFPYVKGVTKSPKGFFSRLDGLLYLLIKGYNRKEGNSEIPADSYQEICESLSNYKNQISGTDKVMSEFIYMRLVKNQGRISVEKFEMLDGSGYLENRKKWKDICVINGKTITFKNIMESYLGEKGNDTLKKKIQRDLTQCIVNGAKIPAYVLDGIFQKIINREAFKEEEKWQYLCDMFLALLKFNGYEATEADVRWGNWLSTARDIENKYYDGTLGRITNAERYMRQFSMTPLTVSNNIVTKTLGRIFYKWDREEKRGERKKGSTKYTIIDMESLVGGNNKLGYGFLVGYLNYHKL